MTAKSKEQTMTENTKDEECKKDLPNAGASPTKEMVVISHKEATRKLVSLVDDPLISVASSTQLEERANEAATLACMACCTDTLVSSMGVASLFKSLAAEVRGDAAQAALWGERSEHFRAMGTEWRKLMDSLAQLTVSLKGDDLPS